MDYRQRFRAVAFGLALVVFFGSVITGLTYALVTERRLPDISLQYLAEADRAFTAGDFEQAAAKYRIASSIAPDDDRSLYRLGAALQQIGDLTSAAAAYRKVLAINPRDKYTHYNLALVFAQEGAVGDAVRHNQIALQLDPAYVEAHTNLAAALLKQGDLTEAAHHFQAALRLRPGFAPAARALAALSHGSSGDSRP